MSTPLIKSFPCVPITFQIKSEIHTMTCQALHNSTPAASLAPSSSHPILSTPSGLSVHSPNNAPGSFLSRILGWYSSPASNAPDLPRFCSYHLLIIQLSALLWLPHSVYPWTLVRLTCHTLPHKESTCNAGDQGSIPGLGRSPGEGNDNPPVFLPEESYGPRSLAGYSPWFHKESEMTEQNF